jgi:AraC-like DNA-binding protein
VLPGLEAAVAEHGPTRTVADDVKIILGRRMHGERPTVEKIADEMRKSPRTLQRRLEAVGTTYQELLDEVRRQSARRLLSNTNLDAGEVAFLLGFENLNSFTRAFHTREGTTPTRWPIAGLRLTIPCAPEMVCRVTSTGEAALAASTY